MDLIERLNGADLNGLDLDPEEAAWPARAPLPSLVEAETIPADLLPAALRDYVEDVSHRLNVAPEAVAMPLVVALGAVLGRRVAIAPKRRDDWTEHCNLWGLLIDRPSKLKSAAVEAGDKHLRCLQAKYFADHGRDAKEREAKLRALESNIKAEERSKSPDEQKLLTLIANREAVDVKARRLTVQDATPEKLHDLLSQNPNGLLLRRDEFAGWVAGLSRPGREGERQFYLEAWSGRSSFTVDRIMRGTVHVEHVCLSVLGTIQPAALRAHLGDCIGAGGDGLLARFGLAVWPERREPAVIDETPNRDADHRVGQVFERFDKLAPFAIGAELLHEGAPPALRFDDEAQELVNEWLLYNALRADAVANPALEAHLAKMPKTFCALAGIFHLVGIVSDQTPNGPITSEAARLAAAWCELLATHARKLYAAADPDRLAVHALAKRILAGGVDDGETLRKIARRDWSELKSEGAVKAAVEGLMALGWLRVECSASGGLGGRPSISIRLHPELRSFK